MGATDIGKEKKSVEICEELLKHYREEGDQFVLILLLGMSHGFIILTLKKNDRAWNTGTLHLLGRKYSKQCRMPVRFF